MSWKQSDVDVTRWSIAFVVLWTLIEVKGYPHANVPCAYASQSKDGSTVNLNDCLMTIQDGQGSITIDTVDIENGIIYIMPTTTDITNKEQGFFDNIAEQPLKIILVVGLSLALLIISFEEIRRCYKGYHALSGASQAHARIGMIGKQNLPGKAWRQGLIIIMMTGMVLLNDESEAYTNKCGCPPSSSMCDRLPHLPSQCYCEEEAFLGDRTEKTCLEWRLNALQPLRYPLTRQPLGKIMIKGKDASSSGQPTLLSQGYCPIKNPLPPRRVQLGYIAGSATNSTVDHVYAHPQFGLVGVNATTHAKARFGKEGHYQDNYEQYVPECHCFIQLAEVTSNGWERVLDDWTLWMGIATCGRLGIQHKYFWQYTDPKESDVYGWPLLKLKTPRPPEKLLFQRHLDFRIVTLVNLMKMYPQGFKDFYPESYQYLQSLSAKRSSDPNNHPQPRWLRTGQRHGQDAVPPDYIHHILVAVMYYLADHASVSMECTMEILNKQVGLGFAKRPGEENVLSIPYDLSGYAQSWQKIRNLNEQTSKRRSFRM